MSGSRSQRRLWRHPYVAVAAAVLFASAIAGVGGTLASFTAETQNKTSTFAGGWIGAATYGATPVTPSGYNGVLAWTPAAHGLDGQSVYGVDNGTSSTCPASLSSYSQLTTTAATTGAYTDSSTTLDNPRANVNGHYACYQIVSTRSASTWTASTTFPATVLGLVPTGISSSAGAAPTIGTTYTITYNQNVTVPNGTTVTACLQPSANQVVFGTSSGGTCTATLGTIAVPGTSSKENDCAGSTVTATNNSVVIALKNCSTGKGNQVTFSGAAAYTATGSTVTSTTGAAVQCTTALCKPTTSF